MSMTRYQPGIYAIINDDSNTRELFVDNKRIKSYRKTMLTVNVKNNMYITSTILSTGVFEIEYIGDTYNSVIGNVSNQV